MPAAPLHALLRFAVGTTGAFVACEAMGWYPSFLAPLLAGVLIAQSPGALHPKAGLFLIVIQGSGAYCAYILTSLLHEVPTVLFGTVGIIILVCFANLARGRGYLPILLVLISFATIPVVTMLIPEQASAMPFAFARAMVVAVLFVWIVDSLWPKAPQQGETAAAATFATPIKLAITGTAIVLPLMLVYLMYGITDALPILITTIVLIINFDPRRSSVQSMAMLIGNFFGGMIALLAYAILQISASLMTLFLTTFIIALLFASPIASGGPRSALGLITFNQALVLFSLALVPGGSGAGLWGTRLFQFAIACFFAVGMMTLLFRPPRPSPSAAAS